MSDWTRVGGINQIKGNDNAKVKSNKKLKDENKTAHDLSFFLFPPEETTAGILPKPARIKSDTGKELRGLFHNFTAQLKINLFFKYSQAIYFAHTI